VAPDAPPDVARVGLTVWRHVPPSGGCDDEHPQAGAGYDYLTRQVAALDATEKGHTGLASYYAERGESPGVWIGSGMDGIEGLAAGDPVTAGQMRALFGCGLHPLAELRQQQLEGPDLATEDFQNVARLGAPFKMVDNDLRPFRVQVANRIAALNTSTHSATADSGRRSRPPNRRRHGRRPLLAPPRAGACRPRSAALAPAQRAVRARPPAHLSRQITALRT
jgi:TrwC relaxase